MLITKEDISEAFDIWDAEGGENERAWYYLIISTRWPNGITCYWCGSQDFYHIDKGTRFRCASCLKKFSPIGHTVFENTKLIECSLFATLSLLLYDTTETTVGIAEQLYITQLTAWRLKKKFLPYIVNGKFICKEKNINTANCLRVA